DGWFNETRFDGDNLRLSKRLQIPNVDDLGGDGSGLTLIIRTNGDNNSWGFRNATTLGRDKEMQITAGWDFRYTSQAINEFDTFFFRPTIFPPAQGEITFNFPLPRSRQIDPGLFLDGSLPLGERLTFK